MTPLPPCITLLVVDYNRWCLQCDLRHVSGCCVRKLTLEELRVIEDHLGQLDQQMADLLTAHHDAVQRLAEVPGLGVDSAQQIFNVVYRRLVPRLGHAQAIGAIACAV